VSDHPALGTLRAHRVADAWAAFDAVCAGADGLNAFLAVDREATGLDVGPLAGVPVAIKDNLATHELPTTCGSRVLEGYMSPFEATAVRRLRDAGAAILGKTNMDEFAMGSSNENSAFGPVRNPLDRTRVPGGSSGGSAAAVAAGVVRLALGSETGGSVRQPAAFCGIVGEIAAAAGLQIIAGHDRFDATSAPHAVPEFLPPTVDGASADPRPLAGLVIGRPVEYFPASLDARIAAHCRHALTVLESLGAEIRDVSLPSTDLAIPVYYIIAPAEASSNLARYDGVRYGRRAMADDLGAMYERTRSEGFGAEVTRRILLGTYVLSAGYYDAYYRRAQAVRELIRQEFSQVFASGVHLLFTPTAPTPAFRIGEVSDPYEMYLSDIFTVTANLVGIPAMSQPIGRVDGLPIGGQFMAPHFTEPTMLRAAAALERALGAEAHQ